MLSELGQVGTDEAFTWLRTFARSHNRKLTDVATSVVDRTLGEQERTELLRTAGSSGRDSPGPTRSEPRAPQMPPSP